MIQNHTQSALRPFVCRTGAPVSAITSLDSHNITCLAVEPCLALYVARHVSPTTSTLQDGLSSRAQSFFGILLCCRLYFIVPHSEHMFEKKKALFVLPWMFSCPQQAIPLILFRLRSIFYSPIFFFVSVCCTPPVFACIACFFCNQVNKWSTAANHMRIRPATSEMYWLTCLSHQRMCFCKGGLLGKACAIMVAPVMGWAWNGRCTTKDGVVEMRMFTGYKWSC